MRIVLLFFVLFYTFGAFAQVFIPMPFWKPSRSVRMTCVQGCYPTPNVEFTSSLYYVPLSSTATFAAYSASNTDPDFCFGPTTAGGCGADPVGNGLYPLQCAGPGLGSIDGSAVAGEADYTAPASATTDICYATDFNEGQARASVNIQTFTPVSITSPVTSPGSPRNICVGLTQAITGVGGLGTLNWSVASGGGSVSPSTGNSTTFTAPLVAASVQVKVVDSTTSMDATAYFNVISNIDLTPTTNPLQVVINDSAGTKIHYPATSGVNYTANLNFSANCGVQNYSASCAGGGSLSATTGITNNQNIAFRPPATTGTSTVTFTDSTTPTAQTASRTVYVMKPEDVTANWGYHFCVKYSHSTFGGFYKVKCWGKNGNGELGLATTTNMGVASTDLGYGLATVKDSSGSDLLVTDISAGLYHTCAILSDNTVKCWGSNTYGQLGYDNTTQLTSPTSSTVNIGVGTPKKIYAAGFKTCLVFSDDRVKCWGRNARGDLGQNNVTNYGSNNTTASMSTLGYIQIGGADLKVIKMGLGENYTCALTTAAFAPGAQKVYCWGFGNSATCALGTMPDANYCGELGRATTNATWGDGTNLMSALTTVNLGLTGSEVVIDIAAGRKHICAIIAPNAVATSGTPICWGRNSRGQLGIDSTATIGDNETPTTRISSMTTAKALYASGEAMCALMTTDAIRCWGRGARGQLLGSNNTGTGGAGYTVNIGDDGAPAMSAIVNASLGTGRTVKKLAMAYEASCAILDNDFIKCWGSQYCGTGSANLGCLMSGYPTMNTASNPVAAPNMMQGRYIGDNASEVGDLLPYVNH